MEKLNLKAVLLERFEGAIVLTGLEGVQIINGKELNPKSLISFADFSVPELITLDLKDLITPMLDKIKKDLVDKLITDNDYSDLVVGVWGDFGIYNNPLIAENKIRLVCNLYIDAIVK